MPFLTHHTLLQHCMFPSFFSSRCDSLTFPFKNPHFHLLPALQTKHQTPKEKQKRERDSHSLILTLLFSSSLFCFAQRRKLPTEYSKLKQDNQNTKKKN